MPFDPMPRDPEPTPWDQPDRSESTRGRERSVLIALCVVALLLTLLMLMPDTMILLAELLDRLLPS